MIKRTYVKDNKDVIKIINDKFNKIISIKPVKKIKRDGIIQRQYITSYCIKYEKML